MDSKMTMLNRLTAEPSAQQLIEKIHARLRGCPFQYKSVEQLAQLKSKRRLKRIYHP